MINGVRVKNLAVFGSLISPPPLDLPFTKEPKRPKQASPAFKYLTTQMDDFPSMAPCGEIINLFNLFAAREVSPSV
jgi:hypothetical protein